MIFLIRKNQTKRNKVFLAFQTQLSVISPKDDAPVFLRFFMIDYFWLGEEFLETDAISRSVRPRALIPAVVLLPVTELGYPGATFVSYSNKIFAIIPLPLLTGTCPAEAFGTVVQTTNTEPSPFIIT